MHDEFEAKHQVVSHLMDMLRKNAVGEVEGGLHPKKEVSVEKVSVKPGEMQHTPECDGMCKGGCTGMSDGGMAMASDEPENVMPSELPAAEGAEHEVGMGEMEDEDEDNNQSAFMGLLKKKK